MNVHHKKLTKTNLYVITGGPGMGKTTLLNELEQRQYRCIEEVGRQIIKQQMQHDGWALPWKNQLAFAEIMFSQSVSNFLDAGEQTLPIIFDRGIPDVIGYMELCGLPASAKMIDIAKKLRYNKHVFITPPWEEIYVNDQQRKQLFDEAIETYKIMVEVYSKLGYTLIELPKCTVKERADIMTRKIGEPNT